MDDRYYKDSWVYEAWMRHLHPDRDKPVWIAVDVASGPDISVEPPVSGQRFTFTTGGRACGKSAPKTKNPAPRG
jgi:hypothetical protein